MLLEILGRLSRLVIAFLQVIREAARLEFLRVIIIPCIIHGKDVVQRLSRLLSLICHVHDEDGSLTHISFLIIDPMRDRPDHRLQRWDGIVIRTLVA